MAFVQARGGVFSSVTSAGLTFSSAVTVGSLLLAGTRQGNTHTFTSIADSVNAGNYTQTQAAVDNGAGRAMFHYKENTGAGTPTVTWTWSTTGSPAIEIAEFSGVNTVTPLDQVAAATGTSTAAASGNTPTTTSANELLVMWARAGADQTFSQSGSWLIATGTGSPGIRDVFVYQEVTSTGVYNGAVTLGTSAAWVAMLATFAQPGAAAGHPALRRLGLVRHAVSLAPIGAKGVTVMQLPKAA